MAIAFGSALNNDNSIAFGSNQFEEPSLSVPIISLIGAGVTVNLNDAYVEPGYSAVDDTDGDLTGSVVVTGSVNSSVAGTYTLRYNVTNSVGNAATEVIRLVAVQSFWEFTPPQKRVIDMENGYRSVVRDPNSSLSYWLDMTDLVGGQIINSLSVDPDGTLTDLAVQCAGFNTKTLTDSKGNSYASGTVLGICLSGGTANAIYDLLLRYTLNGGDVDDRTIRVHVIQT